MHSEKSGGLQVIKEDKRVRIITGHYGSGKTEFAVNYVIRLREMVEGQVAIADLDVVNPYFRTREKKELLEAKGIQVIDSSINGRCVDVPALSPAIVAPLRNSTYNYVVDLGGDHVGSRAFARFVGDLDKTDYDLFFVINANREETTTPEGVLEHIGKIEYTTGIKVTGLINNTHLVRETTVEDVLKGQELAKEVSKALNIPIRYISCMEHIAKELPEGLEGEVLPIDMIMREEWM
ncbi:ATP/GTP-binding protein [Peptoclostridium acidaminophilum DSM 3953]|uniref:ATP/GTP-binding protein n=1 Tax=Peptoclostridium acidaminophilum DSM 3953 TaxID=1286171 RepID=W8TH48_PEPAC|nr:ATP/GTP-binding protein [Peptoclostridium acidaminophilum DSM 3953]